MLEVDKFISGLNRKGSLSKASDNTKLAYKATLTQWQTFLGDRLPTGQLAQEFIHHEIERGLSPSSVNRAGQAIKRYLQWIKDSDGAAEVLLPTPKQKVPDYYELDELEKLIKAARTPLERVIFIVLPDIGLRISEFLALKKKDIDWEGGFIYAHREKTGNDGWIPISQRSLQAIKDYIDWAQPKGSNNNKLFPYTYHQLYNWMKEIQDRTGIKFRFHKMRHTTGAMATMAGQSLDITAEVLGHKNLNTTRKYTALKSKALKEQVKPIWK